MSVADLVGLDSLHLATVQLVQLASFASHVQVYCGENPGTLTFSLINTPGVWIFLTAFVGAAIQGASPRLMGEVLAATVKQMVPTVITMLSVLGCAKVMGYAGMISSFSAFFIAAGKMVSPQTLAIGLAAVRVRGKDAELLGAVPSHAVGMLVLMSAIAMLGQGLTLWRD